MGHNIKKVGDRIAERRVICGFNSQIALAKALSEAEGKEYSKSLIAKWELNQRHINSSDIIALSNLLNCTSDYLLGLEEAPTHKESNIAEYTGLTAKIIDFLHDNIENDRSIIKFLDWLVSSDSFVFASDYLDECLNDVVHYLQYDLQPIEIDPLIMKQLEAEAEEIHHAVFPPYMIAWYRISEIQQYMNKYLSEYFNHLKKICSEQKQ